MQATEQQLRQAENRVWITLRTEVDRCFRDDDVDGLRALLARRGYALGATLGASEGLLAGRAVSRGARVRHPLWCL